MTVANMQPGRPDLKTRIQRHYNIAAPLYRSVWGVHIHHGYWLEGTETKETAQEQLGQNLAVPAQIRNGSRILDVGSGFGASAKYLADRFRAKVVGINISEKQIEIAKGITAGCEPVPLFVVADAEYPSVASEFDVVWSIETISHIRVKRDCFKRLVELLVPNGRIAIVDWFQAEGLDRRRERRYIEPIIQQMLLPELSTLSFYADTLRELGCCILMMQDISTFVAKTWDLCIELTDIPFIWKVAHSHGADFVSFLRGFKAMKQGFESGAFRCGMLIAEKHCE